MFYSVLFVPLTGFCSSEQNAIDTGGYTKDTGPRWQGDGSNPNRTGSDTFNMKRTRIKMAALGLGAVLALGGCGLVDEANEARGRGDAGVESVDDTGKDVIQFPDRFSNVAHACDGHGHRVYVTTKSDTSRFMAVIDDPSCGTAN